jgi:microcystin-dependent protein
VTPALTYAGALQAADGTPLSGAHTIEVRFWSAKSGGTTLCTSGELDNVQLNLGRFSIALPDECTQAVKSTPEAYVEVVLDQSSLGRAKASAVPYAVESAHALLATDATKSGALDQRIAALESAVKSASPSGTIAAFAGDLIPSGWLPCDGRAVSRTTYADLFASLNLKWGPGDGSTTFNVPDLRGRTLIGAGANPSLTERALGQTLGEETHTLTVIEMPSHTHSLTTVPAGDGPGGYSGGGWFGDPIAQSTSSAGGDKPHNNMQPSAVVNYIVKI